MLEVTEIDNRGNDDVPFGYVYFNDDSRVGYADTPETRKHYGLFPSNHGGNTPEHFHLARAALIKAYGVWPK